MENSSKITQEPHFQHTYEVQVHFRAPGPRFVAFVNRDHRILLSCFSIAGPLDPRLGRAQKNKHGHTGEVRTWYSGIFGNVCGQVVGRKSIELDQSRFTIAPPTTL